ncbi:MAG: DoxX family protein [Flavisolibacter sp.]
MTTHTKKIRTAYWISTGLLALFILPGIFFLNNSQAIAGMKHLGMPLWFHWELGIGKFIGGLLLIYPKAGRTLKEWTYVAFGIDFISATIGLIAVDGWNLTSFFPLLTFALLVISYINYHKLEKTNHELNSNANSIANKSELMQKASIPNL